ncbi:suppressor of fused domain protein [Paludisphaera mucosa]|uniref:Suppressor of fused domain protein n=1 Tax=Paludisphaera mucosa TaxID=3030827 RepID=A0ABT6FD36_9BACT|nr:suppressor of fused domain protein [Paludisphaera mucosa]MDG3005359.1 suppressor of fused domain protein [Paludisphaera mucosa]
MVDDSDAAWNLWWDDRIAALEGILGKSDENVGHAMIPFHLGGAADVVYFRTHLPGVVAVTCELVGCDEQIASRFGSYELMICHRDDVAWGPNIISRLARYTTEVELNPGETMDIGSAVPDGSTIAAFLFCDYARFKVRECEAGLLLCLGITKDEVQACRTGRREAVESALKSAGVFPFTDLFRQSVLPPMQS